MIKLAFTEAEKDELQYERHHHPYPDVRLKMEVIWLKSQNLPHREIGRLTGVGSTTLTAYLRKYREGGIEALKIRKPYRPQSDLDAHSEMLKAHFLEHPPASTKEAMATIESLTGIRRSPRRIQEFIKRIGMKRRKVGMIPAKADTQAQEAFKKKSWNRALKKPRPASVRCSS